MDTEIIGQIKITENGELLLAVVGDGKPMYQHIYREAAGIYWDNDLHGFKSAPIKEWSYSKWFFHIVAVAKSAGIDLQLSDKARWQDIPEKDKNEIMQSYAV
ncbi:MAG: hypothetical protein PHR16_02625 [Methylovulum sp.]|nr:hypothetical protein [Methylovulum sp.]